MRRKGKTITRKRRRNGEDNNLAVAIVVVVTRRAIRASGKATLPSEKKLAIFLFFEHGRYSTYDLAVLFLATQA